MQTNKKNQQSLPLATHVSSVTGAIVTGATAFFPDTSGRRHRVVTARTCLQKLPPVSRKKSTSSEKKLTTPSQDESFPL